MGFDPRGYALSADDGDSVWFLDTRMTVLAGGEQSGGAFTFLEWAAPEGCGPPRHVHQHEDQGCYVLDGERAVEHGDRGWTAGPGTFVFLPRGIDHAFVVVAGPVRGLQITAPAGFERYIAELGRPADRPGLPEPSVPDIAGLTAVSDRYGDETVGPPLAPPAGTATAAAGAGSMRADGDPGELHRQSPARSSPAEVLTERDRPRPR